MRCLGFLSKYSFYRWLTDTLVRYYNKCIGDDTKAAARQNLNCIENKKKKKYGENVQYGGWNSYAL